MNISPITSNGYFLQRMPVQKTASFPNTKTSTPVYFSSWHYDAGKDAEALWQKLPRHARNAKSTRKLIEQLGWQDEPRRLTSALRHLGSRIARMDKVVKQPFSINRFFGKDDATNTGMLITLPHYYRA